MPKKKHNKLTVAQQALAIIWERLAEDLGPWDYGYDSDVDHCEKVQAAYTAEVRDILRPIERQLSKAKAIGEQSWPTYQG